MCLGCTSMFIHPPSAQPIYLVICFTLLNWYRSIDLGSAVVDSPYSVEYFPNSNSIGVANGEWKVAHYYPTVGQIYLIWFFLCTDRKPQTSVEETKRAKTGIKPTAAHESERAPRTTTTNDEVKVQRLHLLAPLVSCRILFYFVYHKDAALMFSQSVECNNAGSYDTRGMDGYEQPLIPSPFD